MREKKRIAAKFAQPPVVGDILVNADRCTNFPRYKVVRVGKTVQMEGVDRDLDFIVTSKENARFTFRREHPLKSADENKISQCGVFKQRCERCRYEGGKIVKQCAFCAAKGLQEALESKE